MKEFLLFLSLSFAGLNVHAQTMEDLKAPSMPAATIIGAQVNEVNRPKSMRALESAIFNNFIGDENNVLIPNNYALEFNPYLLSKRTNFNYNDYLENKQNAIRHLSLSLASTNKFMLNDSIESNALGFGIRTIFWNGQVDERIKNKYLSKSEEYESLRDMRLSIREYIEEYNATVDSVYFFKDSLKRFILTQTPYKSSVNYDTIVTTLFKEIPDTTITATEKMLDKALDKKIKLLTDENYSLEDYIRLLIKEYIKSRTKKKPFSIDELKILILGDAQNTSIDRQSKIISTISKIPPTTSKENVEEVLIQILRAEILKESKDERSRLLYLKSNLSTLIEKHMKVLKDSSSFSLNRLERFLLSKEDLQKPRYIKYITATFDKIADTTSKAGFEDAFMDTLKSISSLPLLHEFRSLIDSVKTQRYGLRVEGNFSVALNFPTNDFDFSISSRQGLWANVSWRPNKTIHIGNDSAKIARNFEFIGLLRWMNYNDDFINYNPDSTFLKTGDVWDIGLRAVLEYRRFSAELEFIGRLNSNREYIVVNGLEYSRIVKDNTYKFVLNLNYNITDNVILSYNIGKNYEMIHSTKGNLISGFSLNFGFGGVKKDEIN